MNRISRRKLNYDLSVGPSFSILHVGSAAVQGRTCGCSVQVHFAECFEGDDSLVPVTHTVKYVYVVCGEQVSYYCCKPALMRHYSNRVSCEYSESQNNALVTGNKQ